jgi:hypothetical protein
MSESTGILFTLTDRKEPTMSENLKSLIAPVVIIATFVSVAGAALSALEAGESREPLVATHTEVRMVGAHECVIVSAHNGLAIWCAK